MAINDVCYRSRRQSERGRLWEIQLRPANVLYPSNRGLGSVEPDWEDLPDNFIVSVECEEAALERQIGLQSPPTIKITCNSAAVNETFRDMTAHTGSYAIGGTWSPTEDSENELPIYNTWAIRYTDDDGTNWHWWFAGIQQPNEITEFAPDPNTGDVVETVTVTVQCAPHWILSQMKYGLWGKMVMALADSKLRHILYDTHWIETIVKVVPGDPPIDSVTTCDVTENWGVAGTGADNKDEAHLVKWQDIFGVLRRMVARGLMFHRFHFDDELPDSDVVELGDFMSAFRMFKQMYDVEGSLPESYISASDIYAIVATKAADVEEYQFGLLIDANKAGGAGFDGETCADALQNLAPGFGAKGLYRNYARQGADDDPAFQMLTTQLLATDETYEIVALDTFIGAWKFSRGETVIRGVAFNIEADTDNDNEFRVIVEGNQNRDDFEKKMQIHNLPNIRTWDSWLNPDAAGYPRLSYRQAGFTLRRFWYFDDRSPRLYHLYDDHTVPLRVHEYIEWFDGVRWWDDANGNPFVAVPRHWRTIKADMLQMQRLSGMPNIIAKCLAKILTRSGGIGVLECTLPIQLADFNRLGAKFDIAFPARYSFFDGYFYLESVKTDFEAETADCKFYFMPNE